MSLVRPFTFAPALPLRANKRLASMMLVLWQARKVASSPPVSQVPHCTYRSTGTHVLLLAYLEVPILAYQSSACHGTGRDLFWVGSLQVAREKVFEHLLVREIGRPVVGREDRPCRSGHAHSRGLSRCDPSAPSAPSRSSMEATQRARSASPSRSNLSRMRSGYLFTAARSFGSSAASALSKVSVVKLITTALELVAALVVRYGAIWQLLPYHLGAA